MAIKVNGTTVIDNSRNFTNIAGGFKTVNGTSVVGSGNISAGASTTNGDVGTYVIGGNGTSGSISWGQTTSGSNVKLNSSGHDTPIGTGNYAVYNLSSTTLSGTWRYMAGHTRAPFSSDRFFGFWVRIS